MSAVQPQPEPQARLDLRGIPCPLNFIRSRLALEKLPEGALLQLDLDHGEPERLVPEGLRREGHSVECSSLPAGEGDGVRLLIRRHGS